MNYHKAILLNINYLEKILSLLPSTIVIFSYYGHLINGFMEFNQGLWILLRSVPTF
jgi:hypothetical protein